MEVKIDFAKLDGYGILLINLITAIGAHNEEEIKLVCQFITKMADSHTKETKILKEVENENINYRRS